MIEIESVASRYKIHGIVRLKKCHDKALFLQWPLFLKLFSFHLAKGSPTSVILTCAIPRIIAKRFLPLSLKVSRI